LVVVRGARLDGGVLERRFVVVDPGRGVFECRVEHELRRYARLVHESEQRRLEPRELLREQRRDLLRERQRRELRVVRRQQLGGEQRELRRVEQR
jgi:hypothetical protein